MVGAFAESLVGSSCRMGTKRKVAGGAQLRWLDCLVEVMKGGVIKKNSHMESLM